MKYFSCVLFFRVVSEGLQMIGLVVVVVVFVEGGKRMGERLKA